MNTSLCQGTGFFNPFRPGLKKNLLDLGSIWPPSQKKLRNGVGGGQGSTALSAQAHFDITVRAQALFDITAPR